LIPSFYQTPVTPSAGVFFRDQAHALHDFGLRVGVLACPEKAPWQKPRGFGAWPSGIVWDDDDGVATVVGYRRRLWPGYTWTRLRAWVRFGLHVYQHYVQKRGSPDLVHAHSADPAGLLAAEIKARHTIAFVLSEHVSRLALGTGAPLRERVAAIGIEGADAGIVVSPRLGDMLAQRLPTPAGGWRWVPNCFNRRFLEAPLAGKAGRHDGRFRCVCVGNLVPIKGHEVLIRAFAAAFRADSTAQLRLGGGGPLQPSLRQLAEKLGVSGQVDILGALSRDQVLAEMSDCEAFVLPSHFETFGVVLIEALALGRPVIATRCGGPEYIVHAGNGMLVEPGDVDALAAALHEMRTNAHKYVPEELRRDVTERFGPDQVAKQLADVYRGITSGEFPRLSG
jgi:glycosyltransferase involved in cell wall biosynthesis